jgi:ubiquinone/menaquinone biosynthesis C-methylase UbiE
MDLQRERAFMRLAARPQNIKESIALAAGLVPTPLMDTLMALLLAKTVIAATALGIFDALEAEPLTSSEIAEILGSDPKATEQMARALFGCRYLKYKENRFALAPISRRWLSRSSLGSLHSAILHGSLDLRFMDFENYVKHGTSQEFHSALSPEEWQIYHRGQADHAAQIVDEVIEKAPLPPHAIDLLDLGGGHGLYSVAFCGRYPQLRARVLDLATPSEERGAKRALDSACSRVQFEVGDIRSILLQPNSADMILLANVLHHFDGPTNRSLMKRVATALRPGGIVIVVDAMRTSCVQRTGQLEGLLNLYFGAASGVGLWTMEEIREWIQNAGLAVLPPKALRRMPICSMQVGRKGEHRG